MHSRFEERFEKYQTRLYSYAVAMTGDRDGARDLLHDCVARAVAARSQPADEPAFRAWLFKIMRHLWIDQVRAMRRRSSIAEVLSDATFDPPVALESVVVNAFAVRQAFELLSSEHREVLALVDIAGFSYEDTANMLGIPRGTVMSRVSRARQALARLLSDHEVSAIQVAGSSE